MFMPNLNTVSVHNFTSSFVDGGLAFLTLAERGVAERCFVWRENNDDKTVSAALFTQHYFENTLNWDFENTWQWNNAENRPELQSVGVGAVVEGFKSSLSNSNDKTDDLLTQQIRANMWL